MKKFLPIALFALALIFIVGVFVATRNNGGTESTTTEEEQVAEIPFELRPYVTLAPTKVAANGAYGHWLTLNIGNVKVPGAASLDYLLEYKTKEGTLQGVPGNVKLTGATITRDLLLGSESSGKFRYDDGVAEGTLTLRFRNDKGKLVGKLSTDFHLQNGDTELTSPDGKFTFTLSKAAPAKTFFVTVSPFGVMEGATLPGAIKAGPYSVFSSDGTKYAGTVEMGEGDYYMIDGTSVTKVAPSEKTSIGTFVSI
jgi:hypothetical protein